MELWNVGILEYWNIGYKKVNYKRFDGVSLNPSFRFMDLDSFNLASAEFSHGFGCNGQSIF